MEKELDFIAGEVLLIDKPKTWTSFDVVNKVKYAFKPLKIKIGHAGTLDPLATGLLVVCVGKKTKEIDQFQAQVKEYTGKFIVGKTTPSFDLETEVDAEYPTDHITPELLEEAKLSLTGKISQIPPIFSAVKVNGQRAYDAARKGQELELKARDIEIFSFEIQTENFPEIDFKIICSKGTYIRSLARDFGVALKSGAFMSELRREKIGDFDVKNALSVEETVQLVKSHYENLS